MARSASAHRPRGAGYVVIAEFELVPARLDDFFALANAFSDECIESESGCWQFDVVTLEATPSGVLLYEAYDDVAAFGVHSQSAHLARFKAALREMVIGEKPLRRGSRGGRGT